MKIKYPISNLKRIFQGFLIHKKNIQLLPDGYIIIKGLLSSNDIQHLGKYYRDNPNSKIMNSDGTDIRQVNYNLELFKKIVLNNPKVNSIFEKFESINNVPNFIMYNKIVDVTKRGSGGGWHRDSYSQSLKIFVPLSKSNKSNGCTQIIKKSNSIFSKFKDCIIGPRFSDYYINSRFEHSDVSNIELSVGDIVIADVSMIHCGSNPIKEGREMLTMYCSDPKL